MSDLDGVMLRVTFRWDGTAVGIGLISRGERAVEARDLVLDAFTDIRIESVKGEPARAALRPRSAAQCTARQDTHQSRQRRARSQ